MSYNGILKLQPCKNIRDVADPVKDQMTLAKFLVLRMSVFILILLRSTAYEKNFSPKKQEAGFLFVCFVLFCLPLLKERGPWLQAEPGSDFLTWSLLDTVNHTGT